MTRRVVFTLLLVSLLWLAAVAASYFARSRQFHRVDVQSSAARVFPCGEILLGYEKRWGSPYLDLIDMQGRLITRLEVPGEEFQVPTLRDSEAVYVLTRGSTGPGNLRCYGFDGSPRFSVAVEGQFVHARWHPDSHTIFMHGLVDETLLATVFSAEGKQLWSIPLPETGLSRLLSRSVILVYQDGLLRALSSTGKELWSLPYTFAIESTAQDADLLAVIDHANLITVLIADGTIVWRDTPDFITASSTATDFADVQLLLKTGQLFVLERAGRLSKFSQSGSLLWQKKFDSDGYASITSNREGDLLVLRQRPIGGMRQVWSQVTRTPDNRLRCAVDLRSGSSGELLWSILLPAADEVHGCFTTEDGRVFVILKRAGRHALYFVNGRA